MYIYSTKQHVNVKFWENNTPGLAIADWQEYEEFNHNIEQNLMADWVLWDFDMMK